MANAFATLNVPSTRGRSRSLTAYSAPYPGIMQASAAARIYYPAYRAYAALLERPVSIGVIVLVRFLSKYCFSRCA